MRTFCLIVVPGRSALTSLVSSFRPLVVVFGLGKEAQGNNNCLSDSLELNGARTYGV